MNKYPYIQLWVNDLVNDPKVAPMTTLAFGAYCRLLFKHAWHQDPVGTLPDNDSILARWAELSPQEWDAVKADVRSCFKRKKDGRLHQTRMKLEYEKLIKARDERSQLGKNAASVRWSKQKELHADALPEQCPEDATSHSDSNSNSSFMDDGVVRELKRWGIEGPNLRTFARSGFSQIEILLAGRQARTLSTRKDKGAGLLASWLTKKQLPRECAVTPEIVCALVREGRVVAVDGLTVQPGLVAHNSKGLHVYQIGSREAVKVIPCTELSPEKLTIAEPAEEGKTNAA